MSQSSLVLDVEGARRRLAGRVHETPLLTATGLDDLVDGVRIFFKAEHLQKTGSFKARGATNAVARIAESGSAKGVVAFSTGNHGLALSYAAKKVGLPATVVVPQNLPRAKCELLKAYGAQLEFCQPSFNLLAARCKQLAEERDFVEVAPFSNMDVLAGQATVGVEIMEQAPDVEAIFVSIGGGSLASGISYYLQQKHPNVDLYLVEPEGKELEKMLAGEKLRDSSNDVLDTVADGARVRWLGEACERILLQRKSHVVTVNDEEILAAQRLIWQYLKQAVEPTAGVALAGLLKTKPRYSKVAVVLCGGNVSFPEAATVPTSRVAAQSG